MANVFYKSLSSLSPIILKYQYNRNEELVSSNTFYTNGYNTSNLQSLNRYQDIAINKGTCFVLTSSISLSSFFSAPEENRIGKLPVSILLQPRFSSNFYVTYKENSFSMSLSSDASFFYISEIKDSNQVEIFVNNKILQIEKNYPYQAYLSDRPLYGVNLHRQRFNVVYQNNNISFYTLTDSGYRYLALNKYDYTLRATGTLLNNSVYNDYIFNCVPITSTTQQLGFKPTNDWVTYYFDIESGAENKSVAVNKDLNPVSNFLLDFPVETAIKSGTATINIANLKTNTTPTGGPASIDNTYIKNTITSN